MLQFDTDSTKPFFDVTVTLDGTDYVLAFAYNQRESRFYVSIGTTAGVWLATGAAVCCNIPLFANQVHAAGMPAGRLLVQPNGPNDAPPALGELGASARCVLGYLEAVDLAAAGLT